VSCFHHTVYTPFILVKNEDVSPSIAESNAEDVSQHLCSSDDGDFSSSENVNVTLQHDHYYSTVKKSVVGDDAQMYILKGDLTKVRFT
jgi:hypothetical protein